MGHPLDARSDIYSLGVLAYRVLSGNLPFNGPNARDFLLQHIGTVPTPLVEVIPAMQDDPDLSAIVMRCLAKEPRGRFQTAEDLVRALESPPQVAGRLSLPLLPRAISTVSEVIFARRPQVDARPAPEGPLLELPTGSVTPVPPRVADTLSSTLGPPRWRTPVLVGLGALVAAMAFLALRGRSSSGLDEAAAELDSGKAREALATLEKLEKSGTPAAEVAGLRAAALHAVRDHATELKVLLASREASSVLDRRALAGVAEDLAREGGEGPRSDFLDQLDPGRSAAALRAIAESGTSEAAWGALRYLEAQHRTETLDLVGVYGKWLDGSDCPARVVAARRLGELGRPQAVAALQKARKRKVPPRCGQDEIAEALKVLEGN
jgi:hypothetical protein